MNRQNEPTFVPYLALLCLLCEKDDFVVHGDDEEEEGGEEGDDAPLRKKKRRKRRNFKLDDDEIALIQENLGLRDKRYVDDERWVWRLVPGLHVFVVFILQMVIFMVTNAPYHDFLRITE